MDALKVLIADRDGGIIFTSDEIHDDYADIVREHNIPLALAAARDEKKRVLSIGVDDFQASRRGVEMLIARGRRSIAMIAGSLEDPIAGRPRADGRVPFGNGRRGLRWGERLC